MRKFMEKNFLAGLLAGVMLLSLSACGGGSGEMKAPETEKVTEEKTGTKTETQAAEDAETKAADLASQLDVVLIGPQIKYYQKRIEELCAPYGTKVMVISNVDFGRMDGKKVLTDAYALLGKTL